MVRTAAPPPYHKQVNQFSPSDPAHLLIMWKKYLASLATWPSGDISVPRTRLVVHCLCSCDIQHACPVARLEAILRIIIGKPSVSHREHRVTLVTSKRLEAQALVWLAIPSTSSHSLPCLSLTRLTVNKRHLRRLPWLAIQASCKNHQFVQLFYWQKAEHYLYYLHPLIQIL